MNSIVNEKNYISQKLGIPYESLSQSYIRSEVVLGVNAQIAFTLQAGKNPTSIVTERLLQLNDQFVITHVNLGLKKVPVAQTTQQQLNANVLTWDNPVALALFANAPSYYNGNFEMTINRREYIPTFPMRAFRRVGATQSGSVLVATGGATDTFEDNRGVDEYPNGLYGFFPTDPTIIDGRQTLDTNVNLGASVNFVDGTNVEVLIAVFEARGYLLVNTKD